MMAGSFRPKGWSLLLAVPALVLLACVALGASALAGPAVQPVPRGGGPPQGAASQGSRPGFPASARAGFPASARAGFPASARAGFPASARAGFPAKRRERPGSAPTTPYTPCGSLSFAPPVTYYVGIRP